MVEVAICVRAACLEQGLEVKRRHRRPQHPQSGVEEKPARFSLLVSRSLWETHWIWSHLRSRQNTTKAALSMIAIFTATQGPRGSSSPVAWRLSKRRIVTFCACFTVHHLSGALEAWRPRTAHLRHLRHLRLRRHSLHLRRRCHRRQMASTPTNKSPGKFGSAWLRSGSVWHTASCGTPLFRFGLGGKHVEQQLECKDASLLPSP